MIPEFTALAQVGSPFANLSVNFVHWSKAIHAIRGPGEEKLPRTRKRTVHVPGSKVAILGMGDLQPLTGNPYNGAL